MGKLRQRKRQLSKMLSVGTCLNHWGAPMDSVLRPFRAG
jgi:hypothetical protein